MILTTRASLAQRFPDSWFRNHPEPSKQMGQRLRVFLVSGEAANIDVAESESLTDVRSLKRLLQAQCGATRFRQRLISCSDGTQVDDATLLPLVPMELQLVLLGFRLASDDEIKELMSAAERGSVADLEAILQRPQDPNLTNDRTRHQAWHSNQSWFLFVRNRLRRVCFGLRV